MVSQCTMYFMKIAIAISGGVDSALAAYLLKEQGHDVFGLFMKNWEETKPDGSCHAQEDQADAEAVCEKMGIPCYTVNFTKEYRDRVFASFLTDLKAGLTPNPDILCNREIKFKSLYEKAVMLGADKLATGHYCRQVEGKLLKGLDPSKDQSYFLYTLKKALLESRVLFPIGHLEKTQVRQMAKERGLVVHNKRDSVGICFIGKRNFSEFISQYLPYQEGNMVSHEGKVLGTHHGVAFYTIGQRKGLGIGGEGDAYFVVGKNIQTNELIVAQGKDHPTLFTNTLTANKLSWVDKAPSLPYKCTAKVRYRAIDMPCLIEADGEGVKVRFDQPERAVTAGQSIVFYAGQECLGGGIITAAFNSEPARQECLKKSQDMAIAH